MKAKKTYYLDENGKPTTDVNKAVSLLAREGAEIAAGVARRYDITDGAITEKKAEKAGAENKAAKPGENK